MQLKMSGKWRPSYLGLNVLTVVNEWRVRRPQKEFQRGYLILPLLWLFREHAIYENTCAIFRINCCELTQWYLRSWSTAIQTMACKLFLSSSYCLNDVQDSNERVLETYLWIITRLQYLQCVNNLCYLILALNHRHFDEILMEFW